MPSDLPDLIETAAAKMPCRECGAMPCVLVFLKVKRGKPPVSKELIFEPGFCQAHLPKRVRRGAKKAKAAL